MSRFCSIDCVGGERRVVGFGLIWLPFLFCFIFCFSGEAVWDKPDVIVGVEAHAKALEKRYAGLQQPLLLHMLSYLKATPDRMAAAGVCPSWLEGTRHKTFKLRVSAVMGPVVLCVWYTLEGLRVAF